MHKQQLTLTKLLRLSNQSPVNARRIFEPYWRTIAVTVVKDLQTRPQIVQLVCDLLNLSVPQFLNQTQFFTIPYLVLTKKKEILQRVAESCGPEHSVKSLCMGHAQLAAILSYLLLQQWEDMENSIMSLLCHASPEFKDVDLIELIKSAPMLTTFELLKIAGEEEEGKSARVNSSFPVYRPLRTLLIFYRFIRLYSLLPASANEGLAILEARLAGLAVLEAFLSSMSLQSWLYSLTL